ncbi:MAG: alpha-ketoglutarate-dependent dioxygenase AlkB [Alphaproteobacteria bacterium]|nr:alpha-ketoglutarate-dependent dioxygenase AlkB [Alphaproteobacteria bacterium]
MVAKITIAPDVFLWREKFSPRQQKALLDDVLARLEQAPLYRPVMPNTGKAFSVEESNFGALGWVSDKSGYRYQPMHPVTGTPWPAIPPALLALWDEINAPPTPECCLVNLYRTGAKMGLHQDRDEKDTSAAVIGVSLGDEALFRIGSAVRGGKTASVLLASGDVIAFGGTARLAYHGIDRIRPGTSRLVPGGGRLSLTLRRVRPKKRPPAGGPGARCALNSA